MEVADAALAVADVVVALEPVVREDAVGWEDEPHPVTSEATSARKSPTRPPRDRTIVADVSPIWVFPDWRAARRRLGEARTTLQLGRCAPPRENISSSLGPAIVVNSPDSPCDSPDSVDPCRMLYFRRTETSLARGATHALTHQPAVGPSSKLRRSIALPTRSQRAFALSPPTTSSTSSRAPATGRS